MDDQAVIRTYGNMNLPEGTEDRPLVTFALFAYDQEKYIREAAEAALSQTYSPLEIICSDDASSDRTFDIMQEVVSAYTGPHSVVLRRNPQNLGLARHVNLVVQLARGEIVTFAAGDDISLAGRVEAAVTALRAHPEAGFYESGNFRIDSAGAPLGAAKPVFEHDTAVSLAGFTSDAVRGLTGAARSYRTSVLKRFAPLDRFCPTEDSTFLLRCLMLGPGWYAVEQLVARRIHNANLSGDAALVSMNYEAIWRQYRTDAQAALARGDIDKTTHAAVTRWIERTAIARSLTQKSRGAPGAFWRQCVASLQRAASPEVSRFEIFTLVAKAIFRKLLKQ